MTDDDPVALWVSRLDLADTPEARAAVGEALGAYGGATDAPPEAIRILSVAAPLGPGGSGGAQLVVDRLQASDQGNDLARLARYVAEAAGRGPHVEHVYTAVARWLVDADTPLMSDQAYGGMAGLTAAECRMNAERETIAARALLPAALTR